MYRPKVQITKPPSDAPIRGMTEMDSRSRGLEDRLGSQDQYGTSIIV